MTLSRKYRKGQDAGGRHDKCVTGCLLCKKEYEMHRYGHS